MDREKIYKIIKNIYKSENIFNQDVLNERIMFFNSKVKEIFTMFKNVEERMRNIEELFDLISKYLGVSEVEKKQNGEVFTPFSLINEMLDQLPVEVWSNPNLKWLDPANGIGNFPAVIIQRLMIGLEGFEPDPELRYKHILEKMIYVCDISPKNMFLYLNIFDPEHKYKMNYYRGSFLEEGFDTYMKNKWCISKVDYSTYNPPYNDSKNNSTKTKSLYPLFVDKVNNISQSSLVITPSRWFLTNTFKDFRFKMINNYGLKRLRHYSDNAKFNNADIKGGVSFFHLEKGYKGGVTFNYDNKPETIRFFTNKIYINDITSIINKIKIKTEDKPKISLIYERNGHINSTDKRIKIDKTLDDDIICLGSRGRQYYINKDEINTNSTKCDTYKVITPVANGKGGNYIEKGSFRIQKPNEVSTASYCIFPFNNLELCEIFIHNITLKLNKFIIMVNKSTQNVTSDCFENILSLDVKWTDQQLYEYFELTEDEIKLVEETVK